MQVEKGVGVAIELYHS